MANLYNYQCQDCGEIFRACAWESWCPRRACESSRTIELPD